MTAQPPDPDRLDTPDLEPGGGVRPGSTRTQIVSLIALAAFILIFAASAVGLLLDMSG